jgi:DNA-binding HxlR family transcriptional regulator
MIGGKWPFAFIYALLHGRNRFKELERSIAGINSCMPVKELQALKKKPSSGEKPLPPHRQQ